MRGAVGGEPRRRRVEIVIDAGVDALAFTPGDAGALAHMHRATGRGRRSAAAAWPGREGDGRTTLPRRAAHERAASRSTSVARGALMRVSSHQQREPLRRCRDVSRDAGARGGSCAPRWSLEFAVCFEGRLQRGARGARSCSASAGCRATEPTAHPVAGPPLARPAAAPHSIDVVVCHQPWTYVVFGPVDSTRGASRSRSGSTWPVTAGTGSSGWLAECVPMSRSAIANSVRRSSRDG